MSRAAAASAVATSSRSMQGEMRMGPAVPGSAAILQANLDRMSPSNRVEGIRTLFRLTRDREYACGALRRIVRDSGLAADSRLDAAVLLFEIDPDDAGIAAFAVGALGEAEKRGPERWDYARACPLAALL